MSSSDNIFSSGTQQGRIPGPAGIQAFSSADGSRTGRSPFRRQIDINESDNRPQMSASRNGMRELESLSRELGESRNLIARTAFPLRSGPWGGNATLSGDFITSWLNHSDLFRRFCLLIEKYLFNLQQHNGQMNIRKLFHLLMCDQAGSGQLGPEDADKLGTAQTVFVAKKAIFDLTLKAFRSALKFSRLEPSDENRRTVLIRAAEAELAAESVDATIPDEITEFLEQLSREVKRGEPQADERDKPRLAATLAIIVFVKKLWRRTGGAPPQKVVTKEESLPPPKKAPEKTWIEFKVVWDETDEPVPWVKLRITLPDGIENFYTTRPNGTVRIKDILPGTCDIGEMIDKDALEVVKVTEE
jgi:hypothetical protein